MQSPPLEHRIWIDAPPADVWQSWVDEESLTQWFSPSAHVEPWVGGAFELFFEPTNPNRQNTRGCKFLEVVPLERLTFEWKGPEDFASFMNLPSPQTQATVTFIPDSDGTRVQLIHTGWGEGPDWEQARSWHEIAWSDVLEALKRTLEETAEMRAESRYPVGDEEEMELEPELSFEDLMADAPRRERREVPHAPPERPASPRPAPARPAPGEVAPGAKKEVRSAAKPPPAGPAGGKSAKKKSPAAAKRKPATRASKPVRTAKKKPAKPAPKSRAKKAAKLPPRSRPKKAAKPAPKSRSRKSTEPAPKSRAKKAAGRGKPAPPKKRAGRAGAARRRPARSR